ncbi:MAG: hypothetical protein K2R98_33985 [Gemmataceae bacterium]|nr:hypothetical protein [Gemmataceae bacterium]
MIRHSGFVIRHSFPDIMIYHFPDLDTLRLAITSGVVPQEVSLAPAVGGVDEEGHVWLQPSVALPRKAQTALRKIGVTVVDSHGDLEAGNFGSWLEVLPLVRQDTAPQPSAQTPVLFDLSPELLPTLVGEMLRLGNDRQGFRWLKDGTQTRVLLRVVGPPYYSLLRALEREGPDAKPCAYVERAPRVWVEIGWTYPLVEKIRMKEGRLLFMRPPSEWRYVDDSPFQDVYEILDFPLPDAKVSLRETPPRGKMQVPLRLVPGNTTETPELWVLRTDASVQLDTLVRDTEDHIINQLSFAVTAGDRPTTIVVRVRPSKQAAPVLVLKGESYRPFLKLPNLFLPCGSRLQPPLRRDAVRKLLADDPDQVTWLAPGANGGFTPESMPDAAFRPLRDWVDYVLDQEHQALAAWIDAARFDFEAFVCKDDQPAPTPKKKEPTERKGSARPKGEDAEVDEDAPAPAARSAPKSRRKEPEDEFTQLKQSKPSELELRLEAIEKQFLAVEGPLDGKDRQALWPEMGALNGALNKTADSAICWMNALWETETPPPAWARHWAQMETKDAEANGVVLDRLLANPDPPTPEVRALIAHIVAAPEKAKPKLAAVRQYLEKHDGRVSIRAVWLAWVTLTRLSSGDVLGLARVRDRLLERLLAGGMNPEHELPSFLRYAGQRSGERHRAIHDEVLTLRGLAHQCIVRSYKDGTGARAGPDPASMNLLIKPEVAKYSEAYCDLLFAFGLARLGAVAECRNLHHKAAEVLSRGGKVHSLLFKAYSHRIEQVLGAGVFGGPLPAELLEGLETFDRQDRYPIERLRQISRILDPHERFNPFRNFLVSSVVGALDKEIMLLPDILDRAELGKAVDRILAKKRLAELAAPPRAQTFAQVLEVAHRLGETVAIDIVTRALPALDEIPEPMGTRVILDVAVPLVERGLFLAAHYDRPELVHAYLARFMKLVEGQIVQPAVAHEFQSVIAQCFRGLRKLGLRDEIGRCLQRLATLVMAGKSLAVVRTRTGVNWPRTLRILLRIAGGWLYFGQVDDALPILDEARELLFSETLPYIEKNPLACTYASVLGDAPVDLALQRWMELFGKVGRVADQFMTGSYYSQAQLQLVEAVVLALVSDDFNLNQSVRRWLDEDEYLVRRRIHRDLRALMAQTGM